MTRRLLGVVMTLSCVCGGAALLPGAAPASPGWTAPAEFLLPGKPLDSTVRIGYQQGGTATVAYLELISASPLQTVLHVGVIAPGGAYQEQLQIASSADSIPTEVMLAEAPDGAAVLQWTALQGSEPSSSPLGYLASYRAAGSGTWETPTTIAGDATRTAGINSKLVPAISADGTAAAGIEHLDPTIPSPGGYRIDVAVHPSTGSWGPATQISPPSDSSENLSLGFDADGDLTATFRRELTVERYTLDAARRPASSGVWGSLEDVTGSDPTSEVFNPTLGVGPDGSAVIAFQYVHYASPKTLDVNAVTRAGATGSWTAPVDVDPYGASSGPEAAGVSPDDIAYVLYSFQGTSSAEDCVGAVKSSAGSAFFSGPQCVSPAGFESGYAGGLAFLGNDPYFAWSGKPDGDSGSVVEGSRWLDGTGRPDSFTDLDAPGSNIHLSQVVPDEDGSVAAFWTAESSLMAAAFDAGGPNLLSASVPAKALVGQPVTMSAGFADLWSGLAGAPSWSFGDGSSAGGAQVSHTYSEPGTYIVTVTASDGLGNQTTSTYSVMVAGIVPAPGPIAAVLKLLAFKLSGQSVIVRLGCTVAGCSGSAVLSVRERLRSGKLIALQSRYAKPRMIYRTVTVGAAHFTLTPGQTSNVLVILNATGRKLLSRFGKLPVTLTVAGRTTIATKHLTIRPPKRRAKHERPI